MASWTQDSKFPAIGKGAASAMSIVICRAAAWSRSTIIVVALIGSSPVGTSKAPLVSVPITITIDAPARAPVPFLL